MNKEKQKVVYENGIITLFCLIIIGLSTQIIGPLRIILLANSFIAQAIYIFWS
jgi:hypothetical protein